MKAWLTWNVHQPVTGAYYRNRKRNGVRTLTFSLWKLCLSIKFGAEK